ncbi:integrase [Rhizobium rosettiformans]|uniref:Site-specific integrase n=2 Tax=Rhizobium rosettiformans TaxID=1368430 RepID=A0A4S8PPK7_9HYPH|nr:site-specific integrase [Rhizobium rosettiformans]MBB5277799.1 integrase [Rhizobium rosettiformans]THV32960.1 site-specific integrase [Rhizobium rosettiformans W3]
MPVELKQDGKPSKWVVYFYNEEGKRTSRTFTQRAKALGFEKTAKAERKETTGKNKPLLKGQLTYGDLIDTYIRDSKIGRDGNDPWKASTARKAEEDRNVIRRFLPDETLVRDLTPKKIRELRMALQESGYSKPTIVGVFKQVKAALAYAVVMEIIPANPSAGITIKMKNANAQSGALKMEMFSKEEAQAILTNAATLRDKAIAPVRFGRNAGQPRKNGHTKRNLWLVPYVLFETGIRVGELLALEWDRINFDQGEMLINQAIIKEEKEPTWVKSEAGQRTLILSRGLLAALQEKKEQDGDTRFVFETTTGKAYDYDALKKYWKDLLSVADVPHGGFHKCRHYYASRLIEAGVDLKVLTTNMGHADPAFTLRVYGHLFNDRDTRDKKRQIAEQLSTLAA